MATFSMYLNTVTKTAIEKDIEEMLDQTADLFKLERPLVHAIAWKESNKKFAATRYEPHLRRTRWYTNVIPQKYKSDPYAYYSMGVMQVLFGVAVEQGYKGTPFELMRPSNSILYGCKKLKALIKQHYFLDKAVSSYNQGSPRKMRDPESGKMVFRNQDYVDKVLRRYRKLGGRVQD